ncbi:zinc carboxypeptidase [Eurosta solidaginis]|uniref:zinc carboxypeptidase n=1 Tax=Eurosta solidaginis TaxID=178769 RepID=UPI003530693C
MRLIELIFIFFAIAIAIASASKVRYDNFKVLKIKTKNVQHRKMIEKLAEKSRHFNVWHADANEVHIMVSPQKLMHLQNITRAYKLPFEVMRSNVQSLIDNEQAPLKSSDDLETFGWTRYYPLSAIESFLDDILAKYPGITSHIDIGTSYERRQIRGVKISYKEGNAGIFIESNIHAREWITSATATWFIQQLLTSTDTNVRKLAESYDWYIVPVLNVDGFVYTHEVNRMWRKTRQPVEGSPCIGADANRNSDSHWMENGGASSDPCSEFFGGTHPFSEPEIKALSEYVIRHRDRINIWLAFHSYSQVLLAPYGHTSEHTNNHDELMAVAKAYSDAVKALPYGTEYTYGTSATDMYTTSGSTRDWVYNEQGIRISYTIEFRDTGRFGFILPPVQILPHCQDTLTGILALTEEAKELGYLNPKYTV